MSSVYVGIIMISFLALSIASSCNIMGDDDESMDDHWLAISLVTGSISIVCYALLILLLTDNDDDDDDYDEESLLDRERTDIGGFIQ